MESTSNRIIIIFEQNAYVTEEEIKSSLVLKRQFSDIYTLDEINKQNQILKKYNYLLDCTQNNKIFNQYFNNKKGILIKEKYEYIKTPTDKLIMPGPNISQLTISKYNKDMTDFFERNKTEYYDKILFLSRKDPEYKNKLNFNDALKDAGIDFSDFVSNKNEKKYKLVSKVPDLKEQNTIYITPENIDVLHKLIEISKKIIY